jgi:hypothetical protein
MLDEPITPATSSTVKNLACSTVGWGEDVSNLLDAVSVTEEHTGNVV